LLIFILNYALFVHFFTCIKKRTSSEAAKKVQPFTRRFTAGQLSADYLALLKSAGSL
jgi:hypothetical protein